jgi:hypothetical protein
MVESELLIVGAFLGTGLIAYVIVPGFIVIWDRVLDHVEDSGRQGQGK